MYVRAIASCRAWKSGGASATSSRHTSEGSRLFMARKISSGFGHLDVVFLLPAHAKMRHLRPGMHAGIGTSRALNIHRAVEELLGGFTQLALYRSGVVLFLPAAILRAVVFDG